MSGLRENPLITLPISSLINVGTLRRHLECTRDWTNVITARSRQLTTLLGCCCRRKRFISSLLKQAGDDCILLAVRGCDAAQEALCLMLEWHLLPNEEARLQIVNALESTKSGKKHYAALCKRQKNLQVLVSEFADYSNREIDRPFNLMFNVSALYSSFINVVDKSMINSVGV